MKLIYSSGILILFSIIGCKNQTSFLIPDREIKINFPEQKNEIWSYSDNICNINKQEYIAYASNKTKKLNLINIENNKIEYSIPLTNLDSLFNQYMNPLKFFIHNLDSIFILPNESKNIILIGRQGEILNQWHINLSNKYDYVLSGFYTSPFIYLNRKIYIRFVPLISAFKQKRDYFTCLPEIAINIFNTNEYIKFIGGWPEKYLKENHYGDYPSRCMDNSEQSIYSYDSEHDIYIYHNDKLIKKALAKSKFIDNFELFADDSVGNISYTMKYLITAPRYGKIYYDRYRKLIYRIAFPKTEYVNEDKTTVKRITDRPWSIIILNSDFQKIDEILFDPFKYNSGPLYVTNDGLLIPKANEHSQQDNTYNWNFILFKIKK
ncbi:MAG: DUF4221 family protein [Bacteroidetes bacterium]|nr:DUF4221 family protein [Bacteroidota bacterium]